ncbi:nitronate monooxygenase [Dasania sp. GY-MA-18]|uniref:Nitronate monooxygenase n=1 Tax=Dasania phycosphaerae TaxID=2950436 RepID=A0A9J6RHT1_9GAMM|nr:MULTISPECIES: nitronate monooxygenase [Dasania]MCR8921576.1 nitronate monooxygenase [Dasania sp. GY-MA-18]MCZ0864004.1 nitronate monooxygenase [Dasania phycosphaerae]MCZ0867732.1 nitronate monooxygenase [Dasania phycosphaerae]
MNHQTLLGVELPIIQAPMAGVQDSELALAVAAAGGLGSLLCAMLNPTQLEAELARLQEHSPQRFNINFFCHPAPLADAEQESRWRQLLQPYFNEFELDPHSIAPGPQRQPFSHNIADIVEPYRPAIISFHFGLPAADLLARVKSCGSTVLASATTVAEAQWLAAHGADAIIAQGIEAGGHRGMFLSEQLDGQLSTWQLLPQIVHAVTLPVIAAGGIANAQDVATATSLGAVAAQIGSAYLLCPEANTSALHRAALASDRAQHTAVTNLFSGRPARGIINRLMRELGPIHPGVPSFPLAATAVTALRQKAEAQGLDDFSPLWCGQNANACLAISAGELTLQLAGKCAATVN